MISNKRMHKKAQNKTYKFGTSVHKPSSGLLSQKTLSSNAVDALLRGEDPVVKATRERKAAQEAERKLSRATFAHEMELISINEENKMADMKSELKKVINAWEDKPETDDATDNTIPEVPQVEIKSSASVSQTVFDYVRDYPGCTRVDVSYALVKRGYHKATVTALVSQFLRQKLFVYGVGKKLIVTRKTYTPMYHRDTKPTKPAAVAVPQGLASIVTQPLITRAPETWVPLAPTVVEEWTVESVVDKLNIRQARAVYNELRALLGKE
jgi:hypothetical protein